MELKIMVHTLVLLMIIGLSAHATYTDWKRFEIENYAILFGTPIVWLAIGLGYVERVIITAKLGDTGMIVNESNMTIGLSLISFLVIFAIFYIIPVGGGDMKFIAFVAAYFGIIETMLIFLLGSIFMLVFHFATAKNYIKKNPELFEGLTMWRFRMKKLMKRKVPLFVGMGPAVILFSLLQLNSMFNLI